MEKAIIYSRISTDNQNETSIDAQIQKCEQYAEEDNIQLIKSVDNGSRCFADIGVSAYKIPFLERAAGRMIKTIIEDGKCDRVIILRPDRIFRTLYDADITIKFFEKYNVKLTVVDGNIPDPTLDAMAWFTFTMQFVMAEFEVRQVSDRTLAKIAWAKNNSRVYGPTPYGLLREGDELIAGEDLEKVETMRTMRNMDGYTYREIATKMNEWGNPSPNGGEWTTRTVTRVLKNEVYTPFLGPFTPRRRGKGHWTHK